MGNLNIKIVFGKLDLGGAEHQAILLGQFLKNECDDTVEIIALSGVDGEVSRKCDQLGIPWSSLNIEQPKTRTQWLRCIYKMSAVLRKKRPDVVISYTKHINILCSLSWRFSGAKLFLWNQADEGLGFCKTILDKLSVFLTKHFVSNSTGGLDFLKSKFNLKNKGMYLVHNGVELKRPGKSRLEWRYDLGLSDRDLVITMVANLSKLKDHHCLVEAFSKCKPRINDLYLVLAGRDDGRQKDLESLAATLGVAERILFLGAVNDIAGLLSASDIFAFSSKSEGCPNAVIEAMAAGLPVVGTDIPGVREALDYTHTEYLAEVGNSTDLAEKLQLVISQRGQWGELGESLKSIATKKFKVERMLNRTKELIYKNI